MKVTYDPGADALCLLFRNEAPVDAEEEPEGIIVSYGEDGEPVSVEFLDAAARHLVSVDQVSLTVETATKKHSISA